MANAGKIVNSAVPQNILIDFSRGKEVFAFRPSPKNVEIESCKLVPRKTERSKSSVFLMRYSNYPTTKTSFLISFELQ